MCLTLQGNLKEQKELLCLVKEKCERCSQQTVTLNCQVVVFSTADLVQL